MESSLSSSILIDDPVFITGGGLELDLNKRRTRKSSDILNININNYNNIENIEFPILLEKEIVKIPSVVPINEIIDIVIDSYQFNNDENNIYEYYFKNEYSLNLLNDSFWFIIHELFKSESYKKFNEHVVFTRMATNYVKLLHNVPIYCKDVFFDNYYNVISQIIYDSLFITFPNSKHLLTDEFKDKLLILISEWTNGYPCRPKHDNWVPSWKIAQKWY